MSRSSFCLSQGLSLFSDSRMGSFWGRPCKRILVSKTRVPRQHFMKGGDGGEIEGLAAVLDSLFFPHSGFQGGGTETFSGEAM